MRKRKVENGKRGRTEKGCRGMSEREEEGGASNHKHLSGVRVSVVSRAGTEPTCQCQLTTSRGKENALEIAQEASN